MKWLWMPLLFGASFGPEPLRAERFVIEGFQLLDETKKVIIESDRAEGLKELKFESLKNFHLKIDLPQGVLKINAPKALLKEQKEIVFSGPAEVVLTNTRSSAVHKWLMPQNGLAELSLSSLKLRFSRATWEFGAVGDSLQIDLKQWKGHFHGNDIRGPMQKVLKKDWSLQNSLKK